MIGDCGGGGCGRRGAGSTAATGWGHLGHGDTDRLLRRLHGAERQLFGVLFHLLVEFARTLPGLVVVRSAGRGVGRGLG